MNEHFFGSYNEGEQSVMREEKKLTGKDDMKRPIAHYRKPFADLISIFDQWFEDPLRIFERQIKIDMYETDSSLVIEADVPGVNKEQIHLEWLPDGLKITVENRTDVEETNEKERYYRRERTFSRKERFIPIDFISKPKNMKAKYENGMITISIPKHNLRRNQRHVIDIE